MSIFNQAIGVHALWRFMTDRQKQFQQRKEKSTSPEESRALNLMLETCASYRSQKSSGQEKLRFLPDTLSLVVRIAAPLDRE